MRSASWVMVLALLLAAVGISASRSDAGRVAKRGRAQEQRPLCNDCGICDRFGDPSCVCMDIVPQCHEGCRVCEKADTRSGTPMYQCRSFELYQCANEGQLAAVGLPASRPDAEVAGTQTWPPVEGRPPCKRCGACTRMWPPEANTCVCDDIVPQCHEGCSKCEKVDTRSGKPLYQCQSFEYYNCATDGPRAAMGLSASRSDAEVAGTLMWPPVEERPRCKSCVICTRMLPDEANTCVCGDIVPQCHEGCSKCEKVDTRSGTPLYQCQSFEYYNCADDGHRAAVGLPASRSDADHSEVAVTQTWPPVEDRPHCKRCVACTLMWPPEANRCVCGDLVPKCHKGCSQCEKADTRSGRPLYKCQSFEYYNCAADGQRAAVGLPAADAVAWAI